jgi:glucose/mannose transport system substrate-binding protein
VALLLGLLPACGSDDKIELEVFSWWDRTSEAEAFDQVRLLHEASHPDVVVTNRADPDAPDQRARMASRVLSEAPPATFTANIGADLLRWATIDQAGEGPDFPDHSYVKDVSGLLRRTGLLAALPAQLTEALSIGGSEELYGVPINIHRLNVLYYNVERMAPLLEERPDLLTIGALCPPDGRPDLPEGLTIAIGTENDFALFLLTFENVLLAITGPEFYDALFRGESPESVTVPGESYLTDVRRALTCVHELSKRSVRGTWSAMLDSVAADDGAATFTVMGDWANGQLVAQLTSDPPKVKGVPFPGTEKRFVFTSDTFPLPIGAEFEPEVVALLETIASPEAQRLFSSKKGSIPARRDVTGLGRLNDFAVETRRDFFDDDTVIKVLATSGRFPPYYDQAKLWDTLYDLTDVDADPSTIDEALAEFDSQVPLFKKFQDRLGDGPVPPRR